MTDQMTAIVVGTANEILSAEMEKQVKETVRKLMRLAPGGNRLNAEQATDLAVYSLMNDLNPFNGEAYNLPGTGPVAGVTGYRRKANEYLAAMDGPGSRFWVTFSPAEEGTGDFDVKMGDIAYHAVLHISSVKEKWEQRIMGHYVTLVSNGMKGEQAWEVASGLVGPEPTWEAVGVVDHRENFAAQGKVDKWDRHERAKKRAEKWAIRKAFPSVIIPDAELDREAINVVVRDIQDEDAQQLEAPKKSELEILSELGFDEDPPIEHGQLTD